MRELLGAQFPDLARLDLVELASGWDNVIFRLGSELTVRLPRRAVAATLVEHEQRWLPSLAEHLPLPVSVPLRAGRPGSGYPWAWSVCPWFAGEPAIITAPADPIETAVALGHFLAALHQVAPADAPPNPVRGVPLEHRTDALHDAVARLGATIDGPRVLATWAELVTTPPWPRQPVWLHGDLHPANLIVRAGRITAIVDFGDITAGDPATDLSVAWMILPPEARAPFRVEMDHIDDDTWRRARAWALALGLAYWANSADRPLFAQLGQRVVRAALDEPD